VQGIESGPNHCVTGYATQIGAKGVALSGGQRQRLALARALLRRPQLLLLDEATSNLDSTSERLVQKAIENIAGSSTVIAVAHRLATIQNADVIFVLGSGKLLETGSHSELLSKRGVYYQMVSHNLYTAFQARYFDHISQCQAQALDR
jgi:ATP-binding cassette subfamily B (MDR/TAP) protein 1